MNVPTWDRTHCLLGHEMTPENRRVHIRKGVRQPTIECRTCMNAKKMAWRAYREMDVDTVVVELMIDGHYQGPANLYERKLAIQGCLMRGYSGTEIARRIGCSVRTIERHRKATRDAEVGH